MPRISAPTLVEHREKQRSALLGAARDLAAETEGRGVTFAAVASRAGLARSSVYEYFASPAVLLAHVVTDEMMGFADEIEREVEPVSDPAERVRAFVRTWLRYVADGRHRVVQAVLTSPMPEECIAAVGEMHERMARPLIGALHDLGVSDPARSADFIRGVVEATARRIQEGHPASRETADAEEFVLRGVGVAQ